MSSDAIQDGPVPVFVPVAAGEHDIPDVIRIALNSTALVVMWNYRWFVDLTDRNLLVASSDGALSTQVLFVVLGTAMSLAIARLGVARLRPLIRRPMPLFGAWLALTILTSVDPGLSLRRLTLLVVIAIISAGVLVLARSARQFAISLAISVFVILASSYLALVFLPHLAIHNAFDMGVDGELNGLWRGIFDGKNTAGAAMLLIVCVGLYIASSLNALCGWTVVLAAFVFLLGAQSKTVLATLPLVLVLTSIARWTTSRWLRRIILIGPTVFLVLISVGSVLIPPIKSLLDMAMSDSSFTGRRQIWEFALSNVAARPLQGWGFGAFWGTARTVYASDTDSWAPAAAHAHNAYLEAALNLGIPGLVLLTMIYVLEPMRDLETIAEQPGGIDDLTTLFMRFWFFGLLSASFESVFQNPYNAMCCMTFVAIFGLRLRARHSPIR